MEKFEALARERQSCRNYQDRSVEAEKLMRMVETARIAPSACNSQPWHFTVVNGGALAGQVARCLQDLGMNRFTDGCPAFIIINEEKANLSATVGSRIKSQEYAQCDIGIAAAHLCFAAMDEGLSTCIIGWFDEKKLKQTVGIPSEKRVRLVVAVGYASEEALRPKKRKALSEIATFLP